MIEEIFAYGCKRIGREAERRGCPASIVSTDEFNQYSSLPHEEAIVFVVSSTGQGDSSDSFKELWRFLLQRNLENSWLQRVRFAVFGLGDSGYQKYNKLAKRLLDLGATTIIEKGLGDDQHPSGYGTLKRLRNRASLKIPGQQAQLICTTSPFLLREEAYHPARLLILSLLLWNQTSDRCVGKERPNNNPPDRNQGTKINWNAASYDSLKNAEVMSPLVICLLIARMMRSTCLYGTKLQQCLGVS
ncbi:hypothetical protein Bca4012_009268 [Brassica carinata]|uniref:Flavodoxin-like domain-containing protein n=1 Tax=Brassica carinata TaxID=52824 RepID=A0A8X7S5Y3_BRACI|nr:hypothetical protein Bca52824_034531 [Brassica carinata]